MSSNIESILKELQRFDRTDYVAFITMFIICILIGIYYGFIKQAKSEADYLMGGRQMLTFPVAISLVASFISGITLLGLPTEVYSYGIQYCYVGVGVIGMGFITGYFYLPVFHDMQLTSNYEYLESRFDRRLRMYGSVMFVLMNIAYLPIVIYVPALAFNQVTGIGVHTITPIVCFICTFYTGMGGLRAVVWTDVVQTVSMIGALVLVAVKGSMDIGGFGVVISKAIETERIEPPVLDLDPTIRHTLWSQLFGGIVYWTQTNTVSQNMIQRYLSLPTLKSARTALGLFCIGMLTVMSLCSYNGLLIYATYEHCDPLTTKLAKARDQLLPLFVMRTLGNIPGFTGLFVAGVFSAALSSLSTCLNSLAAVVLEDFVKPFRSEPLSKSTADWIMRSVVVGVAIWSVCLVYVVEHAGTVLQLTMSLEAITNGPLFGIFTLGIFAPWVNGNNAIIGGVFGVIFMSWLSLNAQWAIASGAIKYATKTLAVDKCEYTFDSLSTFAHSNSSIITPDVDDIFPLFRISYMWYTMVGFSVTIVVALFCTCLFGGNDPKYVNPSLLTPCIRKYFQNSKNGTFKSKARCSLELNTPFTQKSSSNGAGDC